MTRFRPQLMCLAYLALLVGATVGVDRLIASRLFAHPTDFVPSYRSFPEYAMGMKLNQFDGQRRRFDALFIGNSRTLFDVNPAVFDARMAAQGVRLRSYNLAMPSVDPSFWPSFFLRYYDRAPPRHLFLGIVPRDLDAHFTFGERVRNQFQRSPGFRNRHMDRISADAEEILARLFILRGRNSDLRLLTLSEVARGRKLDLRAPRLGNDRGWGTLPRVQVRPKRALEGQARRLARRHGRLRFALDPERRASLARLNRWVRASGGCLTLFTTPVLFDREPWGTIEVHQTFIRAARRVAQQLPGVRFIDVGTWTERRLSAGHYGDGDHLNGRGAGYFSRALADTLGSTVRRADCDGPPAPPGRG